MRHDIREKHCGEETSNVVVPGHGWFPLIEFTRKIVE
jgi:hypothetical protein